MILHKIIPILIAYSYLSCSALAQEDSQHSRPPLPNSSVIHGPDFNTTVLPISYLKFLGLGVEGSFGTGFCLDPECRFIGTNYHVAVLARPRKIKGQKVTHLYLATGPNDEGATVNDCLSTAPMKYTLNRDLAIFELNHSVPHHSGVTFSLDDLEIGQEVDIYAYPKEGISPIRSLLRFNGAFKGQTSTGLLAFDYSLSSGKAIRPGASGGIVVDSKTQKIVGILSAIARNGETVALAVPIQALADFVSRVQPILAQSIFPPAKGISIVLADLYPKFAPPPPSYILEHRPEEPAEVKMLRSKAQLLADSMRNFIAVQTFAWGSGNKMPAASSAYEVRVLDGYQRFRKYPDGKREFRDVPFPPLLINAINPGGEWSQLPAMVGTDLGLKIHQAANAVVNGRRLKVYQYWADTEDGVCRFKSDLDFGFFAVNKIVTVGCFGEVWTDEDTNILRISEHLQLRGRWRAYQAVVAYGWLRRMDGSPRLIPVAISTQAELKKKIYWCRGQFMDYQVFSSKVKILSGSVTSPARP
ncbi:MAG: S1 family peptidase [Candidatus Acidiferrales bacterium]